MINGLNFQAYTHTDTNKFDNVSDSHPQIKQIAEIMKEKMKQPITDENNAIHTKNITDLVQRKLRNIINKETRNKLITELDTKTWTTNAEKIDHLKLIDKILQTKYKIK